MITDNVVLQMPTKDEAKSVVAVVFHCGSLASSNVPISQDYQMRKKVLHWNSAVTIHFSSDSGQEYCQKKFLKETTSLPWQIISDLAFHIIDTSKAPLMFSKQ